MKVLIKKTDHEENIDYALSCKQEKEIHCERKKLLLIDKNSIATSHLKTSCKRLQCATF